MERRRYTDYRPDYRPVYRNSVPPVHESPKLTAESQLPNTHKTKSKQPKRRRWPLIILGCIIIATVSVAAVWGWQKYRGSTSTIPPKIRAQASFPLYFPSPLPPGYTQLFTTNQSPVAPTLVQPTPGQAGISTTPEFRLYANDVDNDYLRYKILLYQSDCSTLVRTIDQTSSQTGWIGQSQQSGTAYSSGQEAVHRYQLPALTANTTYCWKAAAIDPGGTNAFGSFSATNTFVTGGGVSSGSPVEIRGGTSIKGGTKISN